MITYEVFKEKLKVDLKNELKDSAPDMFIHEGMRMKDGRVKDYMSVAMDNKGISPALCFYTGDMYEAMTQRNESYERIFKEMLSYITSDYENDARVKELTKVVENAKDYIYPIVRNKMQVESDLSLRPYTDIHDLAVFYVVKMPEHLSDYFKDAHITNETNFSLTEDEIVAAAKANAFSRGLKAAEIGERIYLVTNEEESEGAGYIFGCPELLSLIYEKMSENYYILPHSIHKVVIIPESKGIEITEETLKSITKEANEAEAMQGKNTYLSGSLYLYDGKNEKLILR